MKYQYGQLYIDLSIHGPLVLKVWMVMLSLTYPPRRSKTEKNHQTSTRNYPLWRNCISYKTSSTLHEDILKDWKNQSIHCNKYEISHHIPWQLQKIGYLLRGKYSWTLSLSRDDCRYNNIDNFRSALSSFQSFIFHQQWFRIDPYSYWSSMQ